MKEITVRLLLVAAVLMHDIPARRRCCGWRLSAAGGKDHLFLLHADGKGKDCTVFPKHRTDAGRNPSRAKCA